MSSHREAPEISKDPVADSTDVYAFVSPDRPDTVTLIANFIPLQKPDGGPNFYEFGDDVLYEIHVSNKGKAESDIIYQFEFTHPDPQQGDLPLQHRADHQHRRPELEPAAVLHGHPHRGRQDDGPRPRPAPARRSTSARAARRTTQALAAQAVHALPGGSEGLRRPAGRRLPRRPRQRLRPRGAAAVQLRAPDLDAEHGRPSTRVQVVQRAHDRPPGADQGPHLVDGAVPSDPSASKSIDRRLGDRQPPEVAGLGRPDRASTSATDRGSRSPGWATRWSTRSSIPMAEKDQWNARPPREDARFAKYVDKPELAGLLPVLYPGVFPNLAAYTQAAGRPRRDPADRHPDGRRARVPELHGPDQGGHAAAQRRDPADRASTRTRSAWSPATRPGSPTAAGSTTTWSPSSCGPWPA